MASFMLKGIQYEKFIDYKSDTSTDRLPLPSTKYWHTLEDVLTQYSRHAENKFDYDDNGIAIGNASLLRGLDTLEMRRTISMKHRLQGLKRLIIWSNDNFGEFYNWVVTLKPKDVEDKGYHSNPSIKSRQR